VRHATVAAVIGALSLAVVTLGAQSQAVKKGTYVPPRAADGHADISGVWANNVATPLQRPDELAGRPTLTDAEVQEYTKTFGQLFAGDGDAAFGDSAYIAVMRNVLGKQKGFKSVSPGKTGDYNSFWIVNRWIENRTSLITDPPDGKLPPMTAAGLARREKSSQLMKPEALVGPEGVTLAVRCISGWVPLLVAAYNSYFDIAQSPGAVALNMEMYHDTRIFAIGERKHLPSGVKFWLGDPVSHWEGDTFVVDSTNFRGDNANSFITSDALHITEKYSRVADDTLKYEVRVDDPQVYTRPWTAATFMKRSKEPVYEFACHEGNAAMTGILQGQRVQEQKARDKAKGTTSNQNQ
jgi:hypothetical protein